MRIFVPTEKLHEQGLPFMFNVSVDNQGRNWMYGYTDESELLAAFPDGKPYVSIRFRDAFQIATNDPKFGGMFINHMQTYLIPRELFDEVQSELDKVPVP